MAKAGIRANKTCLQDEQERIRLDSFVKERLSDLVKVSSENERERERETDVSNNAVGCECRWVFALNTRIHAKALGSSSLLSSFLFTPLNIA